MIGCYFDEYEPLGIYGNGKVMQYYENNRASVERITKFDVLNLQQRLPRWMLRMPYDVLNRLNRRKLLKANNELTTSICMSDYYLKKADEKCFDMFFVATK